MGGEKGGKVRACTFYKPRFLVNPPPPPRPSPAASAAQDVFNTRLLRLDLKARAGGAATPAELVSAREAADEAVMLYAHFLRCYRDARFGDEPPTDGANAHQAPLSGATELDGGSAEAYMTAHLSIARIMSRRPCANADEKERTLLASMRRYEWVAANASRLAPEASESGGAAFFSDEVAICKEMTELLPRQIAALRRGLTSV